MRGAVSRRGRPSRSKIVSLASSVRPASRCAQASVSANVGVSATAATSCSTSCSPIGSSPAQSASLSTSFASWWKSSPTSWTSAATASGSRPDAGLLETLRDPRVGLPLRDVVSEHVAGLRAGLRQRRVLLQLLGDERQHGARRRRGEVLLDRLHVGCLPAVREPALGVRAARPRLRRGRAARRRRGCRRCRGRRPRRPDCSCALTISIASGSKWRRSRASAVSIFGRSLPVSR